jgi:SNF2 family DNA or RNA helicase
LLPLKHPIPTVNDFYHMFINAIPTKRGYMYETKNMNFFKKLIKGYVSYYRGAPPYVFPKANLFTVRCKMSDFQLKVYSNVVKHEEMNVGNYLMEDIPNSFFIGTRMISNVVFPNQQINYNGYSSLTDQYMLMSSLKIFSPKFYKILRKIKKSQGTIFIYSNFKEYGGIKTFVKILEHHNFKNYEYYGSGLKRFAIWSGDQDPAYKEEIKTIFNNKNNIDGSKIKIIFGSPSIKEGVSLLRVREVHILEPYWNMSRLDQVIGRAIRFCSHKDMPKKERFVDVYIYLATHPTIAETIDQRILFMALQKQKIIRKFERALKEAAIDCELFKNANQYPGEENIVCVN